jgi:hypothetical protein
MEPFSNSQQTPMEPCQLCGHMASKTEVYFYGMCLLCDELQYEQKQEDEETERLEKEIRDGHLFR